MYIIYTFFRKLFNKPMTLVEENLFQCKFSGKMVHEYKDLSGKYWLSTDKWGFKSVYDIYENSKPRRKI